MWLFKYCAPALLLAALVAADGRHHHGRNMRGRGGRQSDDGGETEVQGGVDFSGCETQDDGMCCVMKEEEITTVAKDPILECTHKEVEKCHYTYVTQFTPVQEEVCVENFEKKCQITFKQMAMTEMVAKCYRPLIKSCGGEAGNNRIRRQLAQYGEQEPLSSDSGRLPQGQTEQCETFYESSCTTKYIEKQPGKFVGDTKCEKLPIELCGQGCVVEEGEEECHEKEIDTLVDVPEEVCDLNPIKTCSFQTKLVPKLKPAHECTIIPQEICTLKFSTPREEIKPLMTKWCIDPNAEVVPDQTYDEENALADVVSDETFSESAPDSQAPGGYTAVGNDPPPLLTDDSEDYPFEDTQASNNYEEPAMDHGALPQASAPLGQDYDAPGGAAAPDTLYDAPNRAAAPSSNRPRARPQGGAPRRGGGNGNGHRRGNGNGGRRRNRPQGGGGRRNGGGNGGHRAPQSRPQSASRQQPQPSTLYGAPSPGGPDGFVDVLPSYGPGSGSAPVPTYGALPSYGGEEDLPSYGSNGRRSSNAAAPAQTPYSVRGQFYYTV